jgi:hypothetical protein
MGDAAASWPKTSLPEFALTMTADPVLRRGVNCTSRLVHLWLKSGNEQICSLERRAGHFDVSRASDYLLSYSSEMSRFV